MMYQTKQPFTGLPVKYTQGIMASEVGSSALQVIAQNDALLHFHYRRIPLIRQVITPG